MKQSTKQSIALWGSNLGMIIICVGIALPLLRISGTAYKYIYAAGALLTLASYFFTVVPEGVSMRWRRMQRLELWSAILFCAGAFCMFYPGLGPTDWIAFTLAGGATRIYSGIMLPRLTAKEQGKGK